MRTLFAALLLSLLPLGCGVDAPAGKTAGSPSGVARADAPHKGPKSRNGGPSEPETPAVGTATVPPRVGFQTIEFQESDSTESELGRDPFRSFTEIFTSSLPGVSPQLNVAAKKYSLDDLKLVGIVSRAHPPRAMFVDPSGKGHVVDHGDFLGKPETVQGGSTMEYAIHWRVDRVREADVVLIREDPANPDVPSATRVFQLRTEVPADDE
jgi:type IV pilus assembly protein PilP